METGALDDVLDRLFPGSGFRIEKCTRWPEQGGCAASCLQQIEANPVECQLRTIVRKWYEGRPCSLCGAPVAVSNVFEGTCAVLAPDGQTRDWSNLTDEELARVLTVFKPICWNCHRDKTFQRVAHRPHSVRR